MGPVIGLFLSRGPSSFFRRVDAVPSTIIISQNDAATTKDLWKRSLSLSRHRPGGNHFIEDKATSSGLKSAQASILSIVWLFPFFFFFRPKTRPKPRRWINRLFRCRAALRFIAWLIFRQGFISLKIFATRVRHYSTNWSQETEEEIFFFNMAILRFEYWISISDSFTLSILLLWFIAINRKNSSRRKKYLQRAEFNVHVAGNVRDFYRCVNNCVN